MNIDIEEVKTKLKEHIADKIEFPNLCKNNNYNLTLTYNESELILKALEQQQKEIGELKRDKTDLLEQIKDANCLGEVSKILRQYGVN
jgi:hypothetical protein